MQSSVTVGQRTVRPADRSIVEQRRPIKIRQLIATDENSRVSNAKERERETSGVWLVVVHVNGEQ